MSDLRPDNAQSWRRWVEGIGVMLATVAVLQALSGTPLRVPNPPAFLLVAMVFAAFRSGLRTGLIAAAIAWLYIAFYFSLPGRPFEYNAENLRRVAVWAMAAPTMAAMVGLQRRRLEQTGDLRYRQLFTNIPTALFQTTPDGRFLAVNPAFASLLGYRTPEELAAADAGGMSVDAEDRLRWVEMMDREGAVHGIEIRLRRRDGTIIWVRETARAIRGPGGRVLYYDGSMEDITEHKRAEEQVRKLSRATEQAPSIVVITDTEERIEYVNPRFTEITGYDAAEVLGQPATRLAEDLPPEEQQRLRATLEAGRTWQGEFRAYTKDGGRYWERATVSSLRAPDGAITHFIKVAEDVTEQKAAVESLRGAEQRFRALIEHSLDVISLVSADGVLLYESPAAHQLLGYVPSERIGRRSIEFIHPDDLGRVGGLLRDLIARPGGSVAVQLRIRHKDGAWRWLEGTATNLLHEPSVGAIVANYRDVTERRLIEEEIRTLNVQLEQRV
ncbi:MAG: PAS domain S-box protein, partial [Gemmatimonadales bacterium]